MRPSRRRFPGLAQRSIFTKIRLTVPGIRLYYFAWHSLLPKIQQQVARCLLLFCWTGKACYVVLRGQESVRMNGIECCLHLFVRAQQQGSQSSCKTPIYKCAPIYRCVTTPCATAGRLHAAMQAAAVGTARAAATAVWSDEGLGSGVPRRWEAAGIRMSLPAFAHIVACVRALFDGLCLRSAVRLT